MTIHRFKGEYRYLSNMFEYKPIKTEEGVVPTVEHAYQAAKFVDPDDKKYVLEAVHGVKAKNRADALEKQGAAIREDWDERKLELMKKFVADKFHPGSLLATKLVRTYPEEIIEGNHWGDTFWGVDLETGVGENHLGEILMEVRESLLDQVRT